MDCGRGCSYNRDDRYYCDFNSPAKNSNLQFKRCNMKINTIYFKIVNDRKLYDWANNDNFYPIQQYYDLTDDEITEIRNLWMDRIEE